MINKLGIPVSIYLLTSFLTNQAGGADFPITRIGGDFNLLKKPGVYKFVVAIKSKAGVCTGSIVHKDWVLTAGHCLNHDGETVKANEVTVMAGITDLQYPQQDTGQFRSGDQIKTIPDFWYGRLAKYDISLMKVNESFVFNDWVGNISVAGDGWPVHQEVENNCMSLGFGGYLGLKTPVNFLKVWNVTAAYGHSNCPCTRRFQYRRLVCAKNADYAKLCQGDDGGPLVCGNVVRGVAHMVRNWYACREDPKYPLPNCVGSPDRGLSIYMLLCPFNDWMHNIVKEIPKCQAPLTSCSSMALVMFMFFVYLTYNKI